MTREINTPTGRLSQPVTSALGRWVYFDVDQTLIIHGPQRVNSLCIGGIYFEPHTRHIEAVRHHFYQGDVVVVWSGSGKEWVDAVVSVLGLGAYVTHKLGKPEIYYDDLEPSEFMLSENNWFGR